VQAVGWQPKLLTPVLQAVQSVVMRRPLGAAEFKAHEDHGGAVTPVQLFGSAAKLNIHLHCQVLGGNTQELRRRNAARADTQAHLVRNEKLAAVVQLTTRIAHEINKALAVIQGNLDLLRELPGTQAALAAAGLKLIDEQIERMRLIRVAVAAVRQTHLRFR
jgi:signal transduction histidine kinase